MSPRPKAVAIMSEETENKPTQAPAAPHSGDAARRGAVPGAATTRSADPALSTNLATKPGRRDGPDVLEEDASQESQRRREDAAEFGEATGEAWRKQVFRGTRPGSKAVCRMATSRLANQNTAKASSRFPAKALVFCATRNATSSRHHRIFSSPRKSCGASSSATGCGSTARPAAAIAARN